VDIEPDSYNLDPDQLARAITAKTKAIIPVHLFGLPAEMHAILEVAGRHNLPVIEDAAQAIGATYRGRKVGALGELGCFSFFPSKNLGGAGDGGMITTDNPELAATLAALRVHGGRSKYLHELMGINSRLDAIQAAILNVKLKYLDSWAAGRRRNADFYRRLFADHGLSNTVVLPSSPPHAEHVYNQFVIRVQRRDALRDYLRDASVASEVYYPLPLHLQPAFSYLGYKGGDFPKAESASAQVLALPIYPELSPEQQEFVVSQIAEFFNGQRKNED
jgi:dTDP-4-amino-4,6-dideoxygalactose transaminase